VTPDFPAADGDAFSDAEGEGGDDGGDEDEGKKGHKVEYLSRVDGFFWVVLCRLGGELGEEDEEWFRRFYRGGDVRGGCCRAVACLVVLHRFLVYMHGVQEVKGSNPFGPIIFTRW